MANLLTAFSEKTFLILGVPFKLLLGVETRQQQELLWAKLQF